MSELNNIDKFVIFCLELNQTKRKSKKAIVRL